MNYKKIALLATLFSASAITVAMDQMYTEPSKAAYVDLNYNGSKGLTFYKEYKAKEMEKAGGSVVSFAVKNCDKLPIMQLGSCRWFYTSAVQGRVPMSGQGFEIIDPSITDVYAVRAQGYHCWKHIYFGIDENNPTFENGTKKVFQAKVLYTLLKSTTDAAHKSIDCNQYALRCLSRRFSTANNGITYFYHNPDDIRRREFEEVSFNPESILPNINKPLYRVNTGPIYTSSSTCYWTKNENLLKGIQYGKQ